MISLSMSDGKMNGGCRTPSSRLDTETRVLQRGEIQEANPQGTGEVLRAILYDSFEKPKDPNRSRPPRACRDYVRVPLSEA